MYVGGKEALMIGDEFGRNMGAEEGKYEGDVVRHELLRESLEMTLTTCTGWNKGLALVIVQQNHATLRFAQPRRFQSQKLQPWPRKRAVELHQPRAHRHNCCFIESFPSSNPPPVRLRHYHVPRNRHFCHLSRCLFVVVWRTKK